MSDKEEKPAKAPNLQSMELLQFLIRPLNDLEKRLNEKIGDLDRKLVEQACLGSENFEKVAGHMIRIEEEMKALEKRLLSAEGEGNRNKAAISKIQNEMFEMGDVKGESGKLEDRLLDLAKVVEASAFLKDRIVDSDLEVVKLRDGMKILSEKQKEMSEKVAGHDVASKAQIEVLKVQMAPMRGEYEGLFKNIDELVDCNRVEAMKKQLVNEEKMISMAQRMERGHQEMRALVESSSDSLRKKLHDVRDKQEEHVAGSKGDREMILDKIEAQAFLGKRVELMDKRVESCFHMVKEVRVHLNL